MEFDLNKLLRKNIRDLVPYSSARDEFKGEGNIFLDANENTFGSPVAERYNRYPDPLQRVLKEKLGTIKGLPPENIFLGNGSDEAIDILLRAFCDPGKDNIIICPPTYGMYEVSAHINNVEIRKALLSKDFQLDLDTIAALMDDHTKLIFICSPNNPTGNSMRRGDIEVLLNNFDGLVVVDEAYINFSRQRSLISELTEYPNLVVMQTLSKAWGLAALRIGMAFASANIISIFNKVKPPYNINAASQTLAAEALDNIATINEWIKNTVAERERMTDALGRFSFITQVYSSDANFLLVKTTDADGIYNFLIEAGVVVRNRSTQPLCEECLRITIGTAAENDAVIDILSNYNSV